MFSPAAGLKNGWFFINTTVGFLGLANVAANYPELQSSREDLGQTFAVWGFDSGAFLTLPFLGPSSLRDGLDRLGDIFIDPIWWVPVDIWTFAPVRRSMMFLYELESTRHLRKPRSIPMW